MYLIAGLGNIGSKFNGTRHNVGFETINILARKYSIDINREKFKGIFGEGKIEQERVILLKPSTYMNLSGESIIAASSFYKIPKDRIIVIADDISIPLGKIRIREKGSAGGHNGLKNIILNLNSEEFIRVRIGVDMPEYDLISYVLSKFEGREKEIMEKVYEIGAEAVASIIADGAQKAMNKYNGLKIE